MTPRARKSRGNGADSAPAGLAAAGNADSLALDPRNVNRGTDRGRAVLAESLRRLGAGRSILVDKHGMAIAGNKTLEAARGLGVTKTIVVPTTGQELVVVQRTDLDLATDTAARELAVADNRASELGLEWDAGQLAVLLSEGGDLKAFFSERELAALLNPLQPAEGLTDPDALPAERTTTIQRGQLFMLGRHRLLCGDSTVAADVAQVMDGCKLLCGDGTRGADQHVGSWDALVTDPPYAILGGGLSVAGLNTDIAFDRQFFRQWFRSALAVWSAHVAPKAAIWFTIDWRGAVAVEEALPGLPWRLAAVGIWKRDGLGMGYALRKTHEHFVLVVLPNWDRVKTDEVDVWEHEWTPAHRQHGHQTEKPVGLFRRALELCGGERVLDPFVGSGTTIIACEQLGRACCAIEIEPTYCQLAIDRWEAFTGEKAVRDGGKSTERPAPRADVAETPARRSRARRSQA
jgi:DNA modification methylase